MYDHFPNQKNWTMHGLTMCVMSSANQSNVSLTITPPFQVLRWEEMGDLGVEMVAMNATDT